MIRIMLLLLGREIIEHHWKSLVVIGTLWTAAGLFILVDALSGKAIIHSNYFGYFLFPEALISAVAAFCSRGIARQMRFYQGIVTLLLGWLIAHSSSATNFFLALLFGFYFLIDGLIRIGSAVVLRYKGWHMEISGGAVEIIIAIITLQPWPTWYVGTVGFNVGAVMIFSGVATLLITRRIRTLEPGDAVSTLFAQDVNLHNYHAKDVPDSERGDVIVHIWTPTGSASTPLRRRAINHYIAAVDKAGIISTGHAALEAIPEIYISHYPAVEIDRSPDEFGRVLRATPDNNVEGRFLSTYEYEAEDWCESTVKVVIKNGNICKLRHFWENYQKDNTYNLTSRNCSSVVAHALDVAFEGAFKDRRFPVLSIFGALLCPELWVAGLIRKRAESMVWTPGMVLDYARALSVLLDPPNNTWSRLFKMDMRLSKGIHKI